MCGLANLAGDCEICPNNLRARDTDMVERLLGREIEYSVKRHLVSVHDAGEESLDTNGETLAPIPEFGDSTGAGGAQIQDGKAFRWVESSPLYAGALPAQGIVPRGSHLPERLANVCRARRGSYVLSADLHVRR